MLHPSIAYCWFAFAFTLDPLFLILLQEGFTPLVLAAHQEELECAAALLQHGADANLQDLVSWDDVKGNR